MCVSGTKRWDFFYLYERDRRLIGSHANARTGLVFAPFLNPDYIRACFSYPAADLTTNPFHRYITGINAEDWSEVPYEKELKKRIKENGKSNDQQGASTVPGIKNADSNWKMPKGRDDYENLLYWEHVGKTLIHECLDRGGFWTEIFDPDLARDKWADAPDELAITYLLPEVL